MPTKMGASREYVNRGKGNICFVCVCVRCKGVRFIWSKRARPKKKNRKKENRDPKARKNSKPNEERKENVKKEGSSTAGTARHEHPS